MSRKDTFARDQERIEEESKKREQSNFQREFDYLPSFNDGEIRYIRILPTKAYLKWLLDAKEGEAYKDDAIPYAEKWQHFKVGKASATVPCLSKHSNEVCPVCDERAKLYVTKDEDDKKYANDMRLSHQYMFFVAWRDHEDKPYAWTLSPQWADLIIGHLANPDYGDLDNPENGHDLRVKRMGTDRDTTRYDITPKPTSSFLFEDREGELDYDKMEEWSNKIPEISECVIPIFTTEEVHSILHNGVTVKDVFQARDKANGTDFNTKELEEKEEETPVRRGRRGR